MGLRLKSFHPRFARHLAGRTAVRNNEKIVFASADYHILHADRYRSAANVRDGFGPRRFAARRRQSAHEFHHSDVVHETLPPLAKPKR